MPTFYVIFARKMTDFHTTIPDKYFPDFFLGGGGRALMISSLVSYEVL